MFVVHCRKSTTYEQLFAMSLPFAPFLSCPRCGQPLDDNSTAFSSDAMPSSPITAPAAPHGSGVTKPRVPSTYLSISPSDLLDVAMLNASCGHSMLPAQLPQQFTPEWAEAALPPERAAALLRTRLLQSHAQLLFERHRREQHGQRNRRLLGRLVRLRALEADVQTLRAQARIAEEEMQQKKDAHRCEVQQLKRDHNEMNNKFEVNILCFSYKCVSCFFYS